MRFESVTAVAFGPFKDRRIGLSPGMTIIAGPNGAGKSSWLAAIYAALCGIRRGAGLRSEDKKFQERHQPWAGDRWQTQAELVLDDGKRIELRYDLDGRVDCSALDLDLGRDISSDLINDGAPDASKLVGLDRRSFARTACVGQAEILQVVTAAGELQESLQRAAASADRDATASRAIAAIENFNSEFVGLDRKGGTKPLRAAKDELETRKRELEAAEAAHARYVNQLEERDRLESEARELERRYLLADVHRTRAEARELEERVSRARSLAEELGTLMPADFGDDQELADDAVASLSALDEFPKPPVRGDEPSALWAELAALPQESKGDTAPSAQILDAYRALCEAEAARVEHMRQAQAWQSPQAKPRGTGPSAAGKWIFGIAALLAGAVSAWLFFEGQPILGVVTAVVFLIAAIAFAFSNRAPLREARDSQVPLEGTDPQSRGAELDMEVKRLRNELREAFESREYSLADDVASTYTQYLADCGVRAKNAVMLSRKPDLEKRLKIAEELERQRLAYERRRGELIERVTLVAGRCGIDAAPERLRGELSGWLSRRSERLKESREAFIKSEEMQGVLQGETLEELESRSVAKANEANALVARLPANELADFGAPQSVLSPQEVRRLRDSASDARRAADRQAGEIDSTARALASVAEAKEAASQAAAKLKRVEALRDTLATARKFLEHAEETVHRDVAPILREMLEKWLPSVTDGLYTRVAVDPQTLGVRVQSNDGPWRDAQLLSHGTAEQVYLLLRIAMVDHLTKASSETCPLLLDDVTAHCDSVRTIAIMDLLHRLSAERQVIVFTQQDSVVSWAEQHFNPERDCVEMLDEKLIVA